MEEKHFLWIDRKEDGGFDVTFSKQACREVEETIGILEESIRSIRSYSVDRERLLRKK
jgi:hypothetical protein